MFIFYFKLYTVYIGSRTIFYCRSLSLMGANPTFLAIYLWASDKVIVSPTAVIVYIENIDLVYPAMSMMVIGPSLPILRQSWWSLLYNVYWLEMMMLNNGYLDGYRVTGSRQRDQNTWTRFRIRIALSLLNNK